MKTNRTLFVSTCLFALFASWGCKKKSDDTPAPAQTQPTNTLGYTVPAYYNAFTNVDHTESTTIIGMLSELSTEIAKGTGVSPATTPTALNAQHLMDLLKNQNSPFVSNASYNSSGFQIESNCLPSSQAEIESYLDTLVAVSNSGTVASSGVAGLGLSSSSTGRYLLTANGVNYSQILFKNLMCDLIYYQIATRVADNTLDNTTNVAGKNYTAMEHNWDVAFGYWSVPDSFPTVKTPKAKYWGSYSDQIDAGLGCNNTVMNAFLKGRAAISNKDMATKNAQADIILAQFDVMTAGAIVQEIKEVQEAGADQVKVNSVVSELRAFAMSMKNNKNPKRIITDTQIDTLLGYIPTNHWDITTTDLNNIKNYIAGIYGFTPTQLILL